MDSIVSNKRECFICKRTDGLHKHHVFYGYANRKLSEKYGCWVYLCPDHHNMSAKGVHFDHEADLHLKRYTQLLWELQHGGRDEFIKVFGRNYVEN